MAPIGNRLGGDAANPSGSATANTSGSAAPSTTGVNETNIYAYSFAQSEKIRQIMARKEAKLKEEEESEHLKNGAGPCPLVRALTTSHPQPSWHLQCADDSACMGVARAYPADLNKEILDEADEEEALGGSVTSEASPLSLLTIGSAVPLASMPYASMGSMAPGVSVGPMLPTAIVNGQPIFSGNQGYTV